MKKIAILGSTGSIGTQTLEVVRANKDIEVTALAAGSNIDLLEKQIREFSPKIAAVWNEEKAKELKDRVRDLDIRVESGMDGLLAVATELGAEIVVTAVVGMIGIRPTIAAMNAGKDIALANKETLVTAGHIIMSLAKEKHVRILPVDSEHPYSVSVYTTDYMTDCSVVDYDLIQSDLDKAGQSGADAIAVYVHWGNEYHTEPSEQQEQLADYLFAHGATLVLGGHAHVPQPMELRTLPDGRTGYLCYCLGNLISNQFDPYTNLTAAVTLTLTRSGETGQVTVSGAEYVPMFMLHASDSNEGRYRLLDIRKSMQDFEQGDTSVVNRSVYDRMKQGRSDLHRIFGTDEVLSLAA